MIVIPIQASACQQDTRVKPWLEDGSHMMDNKKATLRSPFACLYLSCPEAQSTMAAIQPKRMSGML